MFKIIKIFHRQCYQVLLSALISFVFAFTFLFFSILDLFFAGYAEIPRAFSSILLIAGTSFFIVWLAGFFILIILPEKIFPVAAGLVVGFLAAGYVQGTFLNYNLGEINADVVRWEANFSTISTVANTAFWIMMLVLPLILVLPRFFNFKIWKKVLIVSCIMILGMQSAALITNLFSSEATKQKNFDAYLSSDGIFELSGKNNVLVFVLDRFDYEYVDLIRENDPHFFDRLDGFTDFDNCTSLFCRTYPSATYISTGVLGLMDKPKNQYFEEAWGGSSFIPFLHENNYLFHYFGKEYGYAYSNVNQLIGKVDNIKSEKLQIDWFATAKTFIKLSNFRYAPQLLKSKFWFSGIKFPYYTKDGEIVEKEDPDIYQRFLKRGLTVQDEKNNYMYVHLSGSHSPFIMDENAQRVAESDAVSQTKGAFKFLYEYMDEMKRLELYKDATIIIMADHGISEHINRLDQASTIGFFVKPKGNEGTPLVQNNAPVSHENFIPTILKSEGFDNTQYGISAFDINPDLDVVRNFYYRYDDPQTKKSSLEHFEIRGNAKDFSNWRKVEDITDIFP